MKKNIIMIVLFAIISSLHVLASEEDHFLTTVQTTTIKVKAWPSLGEVSATYSFSPISKKRPLSCVILEYGGNKIKVPENAFALHPELIIETAHISAEPGYDKYPSVYLSFEIKADPKKRYYFIFQNGKFKRTFINNYN